MKINRIKKLAAALVILPLLAVALFNSASVQTVAAGDDAATTFTAKCKMCHGEKAQKFFDATRADDEMVTAILKGKKGEKPPFMPAFSEKGIDEAQAKALVTYMKSLKQ